MICWMRRVTRRELAHMSHRERDLAESPSNFSISPFQLSQGTLPALAYTSTCWSRHRSLSCSQAESTHAPPCQLHILLTCVSSWLSPSQEFGRACLLREFALSAAMLAHSRVREGFCEPSSWVLPLSDASQNLTEAKNRMRFENVVREDHLRSRCALAPKDTR